MIYNYWYVVSALVLCAVLAGVLFVLVRRRRRMDLGAAVRAVALDAEHRVLVPNGMGGQIEIEHLLLTAYGIVVVDSKHFEGMIFGSDRMDEWTVMTKNRRFTFPNPQHALYDRIAAIRRLVRDIPVHGHVVFSPLANFSKGRPKEVLLANEFVEHYRKPDRAEIERIKADFWPYWAEIKASIESLAPRGR